MRLNTQPAEKRVTGDGTVIAVNSIFYTIQGEGPFAGMPAVFVRMAGCNLQCPMCDTEYTARQPMTPAAVLGAVNEESRRASRKPLVVITGGEPFRQPIGMMAKQLLEAGYRVQVETNGTLFLPAFPYWHKGLTIVCSPKTGNVHKQLLPSIAAFKYVATAESLWPADGLPDKALDHPAAPMLFRPPSEWQGEIYLQPVDEQDDKRNAANQSAVVRSCLRHGYRLCLQTHKIIGVA